MKKEYIFGLLIISVILFASIISISIQKATTGEIIEEEKVSRCKNFNGREFILTGGTGTPEKLPEIGREISRLNWLCNGGIR